MCRSVIWSSVVPAVLIAMLPVLVNTRFENLILSRICTSIVERSNLSLRMGIRRFTRLTNGFSRKWENHRAAVCLWFAYYNFSRIIARSASLQRWDLAELLA